MSMVSHRFDRSRRILGFTGLVLALPFHSALSADTADAMPPGINFVVAGVVAVILLALIISRERLKKAHAGQAEKEKRLEKQLDKYRVIAENAGDGILIVQNFKFKYANAKVYEMMGVEKGSQMSETLTDYIYPDDLSLMLEQYENTIFSREKKAGFTIRVVKADKSVIWVQVRSVRIEFENEPANLVFLQDVSLLKDMEQDLQQAQRMEAIGALSGGIAHDFNNILTTIIGNAELALMDCEEDEKGAEEFRQIQGSGYRARELVRQILTLSRSHSGEAAPLSLSPVVKEALKLLRATLPSNIRIIEDIDEESGMILADATQVYQVFMNLCTNAKHAMENRENSVLEVSLKPVPVDGSGNGTPAGLFKGQYLKLTVNDNGAGIDPKIRERIFEPYFTTKPPGTGTGLGLATSLGIVKNCGGDIICTSEPGKGSRFSVFLPRYEESETEPPPTLKAGVLTGQGHILFVEDEMDIAIIARKMFENLGYTVSTASSGKEALTLFEQDPGQFDLMITDMAMPGMTGEQLIREVAKIRKDLPLILCTGYSETFDEAAAKHTGVAEYISKPYSLKDLAAMAAKYI